MHATEPSRLQVPSLHTMDTDKDPALKKRKKCKADRAQDQAEIEAQWKRLKSEAQIKKKEYKERRAEEAQRVRRSVPGEAYQSTEWAEEMTAADEDATMEEKVESEEDYDYGRDGYPKEMVAERTRLDKLKTKFKQELQRGASCYA